MRVRVEVNEELLKDVEKRLGSFYRKAPVVISRSLNRSLTTMTKSLNEEIRKEYTVKPTDVKKTLSKSTSSKGNLSAVLRSKGSVLPLNYFKFSPKKANPKRKAPIKVGVKKNGMKPLLGAFVADINGSKIFERAGKKRLPINRLFGPSVPQMARNQDIKNIVNQKGYDMFNQRLDHEIQRILQRNN